MPEPAEAGIVHLRLVVPADVAQQVIDALDASPTVANIVRVEGASLKPAGDLVLCDVAREDASVVIDKLRQLGVDEDGAISLDAVTSTMSKRAHRAVVAAAGTLADVATLGGELGVGGAVPEAVEDRRPERARSRCPAPARPAPSHRG